MVKHTTLLKAYNLLLVALYCAIFYLLMFKMEHLHINEDARKFTLVFFGLMLLAVTFIINYSLDIQPFRQVIPWLLLVLICWSLTSCSNDLLPNGRSKFGGCQQGKAKSNMKVDNRVRR